MTEQVGILHPGEMGSSLAASILAGDANCQQVYWCAQNRSLASQQRALESNLTPLADLKQFCETCSIIIAVCPPHAAVALAQNILECGYQGIYVDANAIAPSTVAEIATMFVGSKIDFVDGGIIGLPTTTAGTTWLYLSGAQAARVHSCFKGGPFEVEILSDQPGQASALKMCFAAQSKGSSAMISAILGAAESMGVREALEKQWDIFNPGFTEKSWHRIQGVARKAWRFEGEMHEIANTLEQAGTCGDFHRGAAEIYSRQNQFKDSSTPPSKQQILAAITRKL